MTRAARVPARGTQLLRVADVAKRLGLDPIHVYPLLYSGTLPAIRLPSRTGKRAGGWRVDEADLAAFIDAHRQVAS